jgi:hypothetical protein
MTISMSGHRNLHLPLLSKATTQFAAARLARTAGDLVVDLAICELVDLVVVLVSEAGSVGEVVDF